MRALVRTLSFFEQWAAEVLRQPALMFTLVVAPFLLLLAFGEGVDIGGPRPRTLIVQEANAAQPIQPLLEGLEQEVRIVGTTESLPYARGELQRGDVDAVAVVPGDPASYIERGEQVPIRVLIGEIDPVRRNYAHSYLEDQVAELNQRTIAEVLGQAQGDRQEMEAATAQAREHIERLKSTRDRDSARVAVDELQRSLEPLTANATSLEAAAGFAIAIPGLSPDGPRQTELDDAIATLDQSVQELDATVSGASSAEDLPPDPQIGLVEGAISRVEDMSRQAPNVNTAVLSAPFYLELEDVTNVTPGFTAFYSPGVVALLVQHLAITLAALTLARMRLLRVIDVLRVAPARTLEIVLGNYVSYAVLCALAAAGLLLLLVFALGVPVVGSYLLVALAIALLILCSLGVGFLASQVSSSVQQAAQIAMLILLASIFFSGFAFSLDRISWPVQAVSYALPATYGISALQDTMLRGFEPRWLDLGALAGAAAVLLAINVFLLSRSFRATP